MSGAWPERLSSGPRPGRAQLRAARIMAAAALGQVGSQPRAGSGEPPGEAHFREDHWPAAGPARRRSSRPGVPLWGAEEDGAPWKGAPGFNGVRGSG